MDKIQVNIIWIIHEQKNKLIDHKDFVTYVSMLAFPLKEYFSNYWQPIYCKIQTQIIGLICATQHAPLYVDMANPIDQVVCGYTW